MSIPLTDLCFLLCNHASLKATPFLCRSSRLKLRPRSDGRLLGACEKTVFRGAAAKSTRPGCKSDVVRMEELFAVRVEGPLRGSPSIHRPKRRLLA